MCSLADQDACRQHLPWAVPGRFFDLYPPAEEIEIAAHPDVPANMPSIAWHQCTCASPTPSSCVLSCLLQRGR